jgi:hypothetical protein
LHEKARGKESLTLVSHCMGALAAVEFLKQTYSSVDINAQLLSPPLPSPMEAALHPHITSKMCFSESGIIMNSLSHPDGVEITPQYFDQIGRTCQDFVDDVERLSSEGSLRVVYAHEDWNQKNIVVARELTGSVGVSGHHSLSDIGIEDLREIVS